MRHRDLEIPFSGKSNDRREGYILGRMLRLFFSTVFRSNIRVEHSMNSLEAKVSSGKAVLCHRDSGIAFSMFPLLSKKDVIVGYFFVLVACEHFGT